MTHPEGPVHGRGYPHQVSEDPRVGKGEGVRQGQPSVEGAQGLAKRTQPKSPHSQLSLQTTRVTCSHSIIFHGSCHPSGKTP